MCHALQGQPDPLLPVATARQDRLKIIKKNIELTDFLHFIISGQVALALTL